MILTGIARLGRDATLRYIPSGEAVTSLALAFSHGKKETDGNRPTQWVEASLWGKQAESLITYLTKGTQLSVIISDPNIQTYTTNDGRSGTKLVGRIINLEFAGSNRTEATQAPAAAQAPQQKPTASPQPDFADFDDDIPF